MTTNPPAAAPLHKPTPEELQEAVTKVISEVGRMPCHAMCSFGPFEMWPYLMTNEQNESDGMHRRKNSCGWSQEFRWPSGYNCS